MASKEKMDAVTAVAKEAKKDGAVAPSAKRPKKDGAAAPAAKRPKKDAAAAPATKRVKKDGAVVPAAKKPKSRVMLLAARKAKLARLGIKKKGPATKVKKGTETKRKPRPVKVVRKVNKVVEAKRQIKVVKRKGGTIRFAKTVRAIWNLKKVKSRQQFLTELNQDKKARKDLILAKAARKTANDGKERKPRLKPTKKYEVKKMAKFYKTQLALRTLPAKSHNQRANKRHTITRLRKSLRLGNVCIMLSGRYKARRVVFLKQLPRSGLCLVTGPYKLNHVPLRRVSQSHLIATSLKIHLPKSFKVPLHIKDSYFKKPCEKKAKTGGADDIFETKKTKKKKGPSDQRRADQKTVDKTIMKAIKARKDTKVICNYLSTPFGLMGTRYVHKMNF